MSYTTGVTTIIYQVRPSVMGAVVTELDQSGQKTRGFIYSDREMLAWQQQSGSTQSVKWEHTDVSAASYRMTTSAGAIETSESRELDPLGRDAGIRNPFQFPPQHPRGEDLTAPGFADMMSGKCQIFGVPAPCSVVNNLLNHGAAKPIIPGETDREGNPLPEDPNKYRHHSSAERARRDGRKEREPISIGQVGEVTVEAGFDQSFIAVLLPSLADFPQNSLTNENDLKNLLNQFYKKYQKKFNRCIWKVFSTDKDGHPSNIAAIMPRQTLSNAPIDRIVLGYTRAEIAAKSRFFPESGLIALASDLRLGTSRCQ